MHTIPNIHAIHTIHTLHRKHSIPSIVTILTIHTIHTVISNIPYPTDLHTILTIHTITTIHAIHSIPTIHTKHTILSRHAIPDRPYTPYIPNIPYHTPTTPQGGRGTAPHPTPQGGRGKISYGGSIWDPSHGERGGVAGPCAYIYTHRKSVCTKVIKNNSEAKASDKFWISFTKLGSRIPFSHHRHHNPYSPW